MNLNFLIIGNGFDLTHGLPTVYIDFLRYCQDYDKNSPVYSSFELNKEFDLFVEHNIWLKYFLSVATELEDARTWIDFEKEIAEVIQDIELGQWQMKCMKYINASSETTLEPLSPLKSEKFLRFISFFSDYDKENDRYIIGANNVIDIDSFVKFIYLQLRDFTRAFEIYCLKINEIQITKTIISFEREKAIKKAQLDRDCYRNQARLAVGPMRSKIDEFEQLAEEADKTLSSLIAKISAVDYLCMSKFNCVLSFNYTNTYERLYGNEKTHYCYIHGKAQESREKSNLILGIDDSLPRGDESKNFKCVRFKKYFQRIIFKTGAEYKKWFDLPAITGSSAIYVHIVGHSLDRTDHDVLYEFFADKRCKIIVYYYSPEDFEDKITKVIQLLSYKGLNGRDELIRRLYGNQWSIKFAYLYDETDGLFKEPASTVDELQKVEV